MKTITSSRLNLPVILMLCCVGAFILTRTVSSEGPRKLSAASNEAIQMFDVGLGPHIHNVQLGRETKTQYLGSAEMRHLVQSEQAQPRSMVTDDFNGDGMGDLVIGYASGNGGMLGLRHGNMLAIAPSGEILDGVGKGRYPMPFMTDVTLYSLPEAADFLQVGDFDSDGYADVMAAARGGQRIYLLAGDGHGQLKKEKLFEAGGEITAMQAGREQRGRFTSLALGLNVPGGAAISVYQEGGDGLATAPQNYPMPSEVTALAYGDLNQDGTPDVAAVAKNEVAVVYQNANGAADGAAPNEDAVERTTFPFNVRGVTIGNFVFDRGHQMELALLADDGAIHLADKGSPDQREFTAAEIEFMRQQRIALNKGQLDIKAFGREMDKLVSTASKNAAKGAWTVTETLNTGAVPSFSGAPGLLQTAKISGLSLDDLLVGDDVDNSVQVVKNKQDVLKLKFKDADVAGATTSVKVGGAPLAAVAMRLSVNVLPGMVVLQKGQPEPLISINSVNQAYTTTTTTDHPITPGVGGVNVNTGQIVGGAGNGQVSIRSAIIASNYKGGSNSIAIVPGTYTLTQGPWDDEFNTAGATMESGDLDIIDLSFGGFPLLTAVSINGNVGARDTTIIQMGTLVPASGGINKDRVMESNNFVIPQHGTSLTLTNLTVQNGNAPKTPAPDNYNTKGGGIQFDGFDSPSASNLGVLTLTNAKFATNTSAGQGGGILAIFGGLTVQSTSVVTGNSTTFAAGGGIQHSGGNVITTTFTIDNSTIGGPNAADGNTCGDASFGSGGGVDSVGANAFNITGGSTIRNNTAGVSSGPNGGGGVHIGNSKNIVFSTSTINNNKAKNHGGGVWVSARDNISNAASTITMTTMNINQNQADSDGTGAGDGGGLYTFFGSATVQTTSHLDGNSAVNGGGIFTGWTGIAADSTPALTVQSNSTIGQAGAGNGNSSTNNGGSLAMNPGAATTFGAINLNSLTFTNSTANSDNAGGGEGGAIFVGNGNITSLNNCTIDSNVANSGIGDGIRVSGGSLTVAGTLNVNGGDSISITGGTFTSTSGTANLTGNLLNSGGTFAANGGTVNMNGSAAQTIGGTTAMTFNNLTINNSSGVSLGNNETVGAALTLTSGALAVGSNTLTLNGAATATGGSLTSNANGTVNYNQSSGGQAILAANYGNLTFSNQTKTLPNGSTVQIRGTFTTGAAGGHTVTGSTVEFNGASAQTLPSGFTTYNNLTLNNAAGVTGFAGLIVNSLLRVQQGTFTSNASTYNNVQIDSGATLAGVTTTNINVSGNWSNSGTFTANTNTVIFNGNNNTQTLSGATTFANLTSNHTGTGGVTASGSTLTVTGLMRVQAGTFTSSSTFNNVQIDSGATLAGNGSTMNVSGNWTNNGGTFTPAGNTVNFNGSGAQAINGTAASQTFNNLTINKSTGTLSTGGSTTALTVNDLTLTLGTFTAPATLTINGNTLLTAGTLTAGTTINASGNWTNNGATFTPGAGTVVLVGNNNTQTLGGTNTFGNLTSNHTGTGGVTASGSTLTVTGLLRIQSGTFTSSSTFNNVQIDSGTTLASDGGTMNVSGNWTNNGGTFTPSTGTVNFNGNGAQAINGTAASQTFNNFTVTKTGGALSAGGSTTSLTMNNLTNTSGSFTAPATVDVNGNVLLTAGILTAGTNMTVAGNWTNNGATFTPGTGTVTLDGVATQTIGGTAATTFNNLTNSNAAGITMANDNTVNAALALSASDITVQASKTLTQPVAGTSSGTFDVNGRTQRTGFVTGGAALSFGNPFNTIQVTAGTAPANIVVDLARMAPTGPGIGFPPAVQRTYTITPSAGGFTGTLRLHYLDSELNGNTEAQLIFRRFNGTGWAPVAPTSADTTDNWLQVTGLTQFSPWTFNSTFLPTAGNASVSGRITTPDGNPVAGAVVNLGGGQTRKTITDGNGNYTFNNVPVNSLYTVTPSRANFSFAPVNRSFSLDGNRTDAVFTGDTSGETANPLDTPEYFVRQQYVDILNREPDEAGFNYWSDQILACGENADCTRSQRVGVAAAFFIENEFRQSGAFIYNVYESALGRRPAYGEYSVDRTHVVGGSTLENQKRLFAEAFVQRAEFASRFENNNTADSFVDALLANAQSAGINLSAQRDTLISRYNTGGSQMESRALVLRDITENAAVRDAHYNAAFVEVEYFGYLHRNPDAQGRSFWLNVLNNGDPGNYRGMVCSFITSTEYQHRFGSVVSHNNTECGQ